MQEPGLDQHEWATLWEALRPELEDAPAETLPELSRLIDEILADRGYDAGSDPEIERELAVAREVVGPLEAGEDVDPGDVAAAVNAYRTVYETLVVEYRAP